MKKYNVDDSGVDECEDGQWVPADVAQALYDALVKIQSKWEDVNYSQDDYMYSLHDAVDTARKSLSIADKE